MAEPHSPPVHTVDVALNWDDPNNVDNPRNWSLTRKTLSTVIVCSIGFTTTVGASIYAPGHQQVGIEFQVSETIALLPLSAYSLGLAFGPIISSPLSETFGRRIVYLATLPASDMFTLGSGLSNGIVSLIVCRFFAGLFAAPGVSVAAATIADYTAPEFRAIALAGYYSIPFIGSAIGPLIGGFVVTQRGWRWTAWTVLMMAAVLHPPALWLRESYKAIIIRRRTRKLEDEAETFNTPESLTRVLTRFVTSTIVRPIHMLATEPLVGYVCLYTGFQFALLYTFVVASPWVYETVYNFSIQAQSLTFLGLVIGCAIAPPILIAADRYVRHHRHVRMPGGSTASTVSPNGFAPEDRLFGAMFGSLVLPVGLFWYAWTARSSIHWISPVAASGLTLLGSILIYVPCNFFMLDVYGAKYGASSSGASSLSRYTLSAAFPLFVTQIYEALGVQWATSLLAFISLLMAPIPWIFYKYGPQLRARSNYEHGQ